MQDETFAKAAAGSVDPETTNKVLIPKIIRERYPDLDDDQVEELRQQVVVDSVIKNGEVKQVGDKRFIRMASTFVNIDDVSINLIDSVNPFQRAFEVMSKSVTPSVLRIISDAITATRVQISEEEAPALFPKIQNWAKVNGRRPDVRPRTPPKSGTPKPCCCCNASAAAAGRETGSRGCNKLMAEKHNPADTAEAAAIDTFQQLIDSDVDGLLDMPDKPQKLTAEGRLERAFLEIVEFRRAHGRLPSPTTREISERKLGARLDGIPANDEKTQALQHLDEFGLLDVTEAPGSIDELLDADPLDLLGDETGVLDVSGLPTRRNPPPPMMSPVGRKQPASKSSNHCSSRSTQNWPTARCGWLRFPVESIVEGDSSSSTV